MSVHAKTTQQRAERINYEALKSAAFRGFSPDEAHEYAKSLVVSFYRICEMTTQARVCEKIQHLLDRAMLRAIREGSEASGEITIGWEPIGTGTEFQILIDDIRTWNLIKDIVRDQLNVYYDHVEISTIEPFDGKFVGPGGFSFTIPVQWSAIDALDEAIKSALRAMGPMDGIPDCDAIKAAA